MSVTFKTEVKLQATAKWFHCKVLNIIVCTLKDIFKKKKCWKCLFSLLQNPNTLDTKTKKGWWGNASLKQRIVLQTTQILQKTSFHHCFQGKWSKNHCLLILKKKTQGHDETPLDKNLTYFDSSVNVPDGQSVYRFCIYWRLYMG